MPGKPTGPNSCRFIGLESNLVISPVMHHCAGRNKPSGGFNDHQREAGIVQRRGSQSLPRGPVDKCPGALGPGVVSCVRAPKRGSELPIGDGDCEAARERGRTRTPTLQGDALREGFQQVEPCGAPGEVRPCPGAAAERKSPSPRLTGPSDWHGNRLVSVDSLPPPDNASFHPAKLRGGRTQLIILPFLNLPSASRPTAAPCADIGIHYGIDVDG